MRTKTLLATGAIAIALVSALAGCSSPSSAPAAGSADSSTAAANSTVNLTGTFAGLNGKKASGTVTITGDTITLTGFSSDQGPDLHLYLANGTSESDTTAGIEIATVAWDKPTQTFTLPSGVDASKYTDLVEHCDKALAVFGAAPLS
ncbi:DM13 domain-containing protein [Lysinimonas soli]|uniref:DM13 domain-containing protein n=1 Tax=Lysinimonas soli TaxID=1074233 RepID=A0ABW0NN96_9MICO